MFSLKYNVNDGYIKNKEGNCKKVVGGVVWGNSFCRKIERNINVILL